MNCEQLRTRLFVPSCEPAVRQPDLIEAVPRFLKKIYYRVPEAPRQSTENRFLRELDQFDAAYLWTNFSGKTLRKIKQSGKPIFLERINSYTGNAKQILDVAYRQLGLEPQHLVNQALIEQERTEIELADYIFCPSPEVKTSFLAAGVPAAKLISSSYGWSPARFPQISRQTISQRPRPEQVSEQFTVVFVGQVCVRKGAHLLLRAWAKAGIPGKLMLCGRMEPAIAQTCGDILSRPDVVHHEFNPNINYAYTNADVFAFPSLEEGSPLVTYEAMAHGLPALVSPMGAGGIVRNGMDGMVLPPDDEAGWIDRLRELFERPDWRQQLGASARLRAQEFTWDKVAARRAEALLQRLQGA